MSTIIRTDVSCMLFAWAVIGLGVWLLTPWGAALSSLIGPMWLWCGLIPGLTWVLLCPGTSIRLVRAVARALWRAVRATLGRFVATSRRHAY